MPQTIIITLLFRPSYVVFVLYKDYIFITKKNFVLLPFTQFIEVQVGVLDWISGFFTILHTHLRQFEKSNYSHHIFKGDYISINELSETELSRTELSSD